MAFFNDEYTLDIEALGYCSQARAIRQLVLSCETPYAIGISGRWGSGKTSLMKYIMASLGGKPHIDRLKFHSKILEDKEENKKFQNIFKLYNTNLTENINIECIWFNPWEHENHAEPFVELLKEINKHFSGMLQTAKWARKEINLSVQAGLDMLSSFLKIGDNQASRLKEMSEKEEYERFEYSTRDYRLKMILQESIDKLLNIKKEKKNGIADTTRLVIFVDDLDRCEETVIACLLKEIKQYLSIKRCVLVFGYDRHHIERSLSKCIGRMTRETRAYIEKLFQTTVYIKQPRLDFEMKFIENLLASHTQFNFISKEDLSEFTIFILKILDPNPRRIKIFLTSFYFHVVGSSFYKINSKGTISKIRMNILQKLALLTILKQFYEPVYSALENIPELIYDIVAVFNSGIFQHSLNYKQCFLHLEFRSHLGEKKEFIPEEDSQRYIDPLFTDSEKENKFLNEIYEMQGKHKSFDNFSNEFINHFQNLKIEEIKKYL